MSVSHCSGQQSDHPHWLGAVLLHELFRPAVSVTRFTELVLEAVSAGGISLPFHLSSCRVTQQSRCETSSSETGAASLLAHLQSVDTAIIIIFFFCFHTCACWHRLVISCVTSWLGTPAEEFSWLMYRKLSEHNPLANIWEGPHAVHLINDAFRCTRNVTSPYDFLNICTAGAPCFLCVWSLRLLERIAQHSAGCKLDNGALKNNNT